MDPLINFIRETGADILLLQEVHSSSDASLEPRLRTMQYFSEQLSYEFSAFAPQYRDFDSTLDGSSYSGVAVLSRFPIVSSTPIYFDAPYSETYRDSFENAALHPPILQHVEIDCDGTLLNVCNLHGPWDLDGDNYSEARKKLRSSLIELSKLHTRIIVGGDTNAKPTNPAFAPFDNLSSVFGGELKTTFNMKRKSLPGYATAAVDMILVSKDIVVKEKACPQVDVSDHLPLVVSIKV